MNHKLAYASAVMSYGLARKLPVLFDAKIENITYNTETQKYEKIRIPMLFTSKVAVASICSISSIYCWPWFLYNDLCKLEICGKGLNIVDYTNASVSDPKTVMDYLLF